MSVYVPKLSKVWHYDFQYKRQRYNGVLVSDSGQPLPASTKKRVAQDYEAILKASVKKKVANGHKAEKPPITLGEALGRYYGEHAVYTASARETLDCSANIVRIGDTHRPSLRSMNLEDITDAHIAWYVARRRGEPNRHYSPRNKPEGWVAPRISNRTVNADIELLRRVFRRASKAWKLNIGHMPDWAMHILPVPKGRERYLTEDEEPRLYKAIRAVRPDFQDFIEFAQETGLRETNVIFMEKKHLNLAARTGRVVQKGGDVFEFPLGDRALEIVRANWMNHKTRLFTYIYRGRDKRKHGKRFPFTASGWRKQWRQILAIAGIEDFRFHDLRHDKATKTMAATGGNLKAVQRLLGHRDLASTARYAHVMDDAIRDATNAASSLRVPNDPRKKLTKKR